MDKFSIDSLLSHRTAAQTPLTLRYWTTGAFSLGVKERYEPPHFFFGPVAASFTSLLLQQGYLEQSYQTERPCNRARYPLVMGSLWLATPTKAPFQYLGASAHVHFDGR